MTCPGPSASARPAINGAIRLIEDPEILSALLARRWGDKLMMHGKTWKPGDYNGIGFYSEAGDVLGLATFAMQRNTILALTVDNFSTIAGVGKALLEHLMALGRDAGMTTLRTMTTNDNTPALRYFQKRGFRLVAFYPGAIATYRTFASSLPEIGVDGIPVRDAIELEIAL